MEYPYAVIDGNEPTDMCRFPYSCHHTLKAARAAAARANRGDASAHYYVAAWGAKRWAQLRPSPSPEPCVDGAQEVSP